MTWRFSVKKVFLEISQNSQENTCARVSFQFIKKETVAQVFSCEYCEISKNTFFHRRPLIAASMIYVNLVGRSIIIQNLVISNSKCGHHFSMDAQLKRYGNNTEATAMYNDKWGQREKNS